MEQNLINVESKTINQTKKYNAYFTIIIIAMFFAPFTSLRIFRIGLTEISALILVLLVIFNNYKLNFKNRNEFIFTRFWSYFFILSSIGLLYNYVFLKEPSGTIQGMLFDSLAYIVAFLTCFALEIIIYNKKTTNINLVLYNIFYYCSFILVILFIISRFTGTLFGFLLLDTANNFKPMAENIHHVAMFIGPLPFIGMYFYTKEHLFWKKAILFLLILSDIVIVFNVGSSKAIMGLILGIIAIIMKNIIEYFGYQKNGKYLSLIFLSLLGIAFVININHIIPILIQVFVENDGGGARASLYSIGLKKSLDSILVGYGPGQHSYFFNGSSADTHETFLTVLLQSGVFGLLSYIYLLYTIIKVYWKDTLILGASCSIFIYVLGGDVLRRLPIWIFLILFYYMRKNSTFNKQNGEEL